MILRQPRSTCTVTLFPCTMRFRSLVSVADADHVEIIEHVGHGHAQAGDAFVEDRAPRGNRIEPATATRTLGGGAVLCALVTDVLADLVAEFGREWAGTDTRRVRLDDTQHVIEFARTDTGTGRGAARAG